MLESKVEQHLVKQVKALKGKVYKWKSPANNGVPDRIVLLNGQVSFVELKRPVGGKLAPLQNLFRTMISNYTNEHVHYYLLNSIEQVDKFIVEIMVKL